MEVILLQIETATFNGSVALSKNGKLLKRIWLGDGEKHVKTLAPACKALLESRSIKASELSAVAVSEGPGSYTGLRIGVSFAKGLSQALNIPIISIPTLSVLAEAAFAKYPKIDYVIPLLDARRMEVYTATFESGKQILDVKPLVLTEDSFKELQSEKVVFVGNGVEKSKEVLKAENWVFDTEITLDAIDMLQLSFEKLQASTFEDLMTFEPFYLKEFAVGKPSNKIMNILNS